MIKNLLEKIKIEEELRYMIFASEKTYNRIQPYHKNNKLLMITFCVFLSFLVIFNIIPYFLIDNINSIAAEYEAANNARWDSTFATHSLSFSESINYASSIALTDTSSVSDIYGKIKELGLYTYQINIGFFLYAISCIVLGFNFFIRGYKYFCQSYEVILDILIASFFYIFGGIFFITTLIIMFSDSLLISNLIIDSKVYSIASLFVIAVNSLVIHNKKQTFYEKNKEFSNLSFKKEDFEHMKEKRELLNKESESDIKKIISDEKKMQKLYEYAKKEETTEKEFILLESIFYDYDRKKREEARKENAIDEMENILKKHHVIPEIEIRNS
ncbi:MAG: hypothetical protein CL760_01345 [Chloroflexi bacterium]|nr:hypothetical protein [Chloroflexota bacterium]|tara:strand:+ start:12424 stop:13410 length:987 start_codon:yes stop_codon:yes gene_type:complete